MEAHGSLPDQLPCKWHRQREALLYRFISNPRESCSSEEQALDRYRRRLWKPMVRCQTNCLANGTGNGRRCCTDSYQIHANLADLKNKRWIGIAADYGSPWFAARPTALQMAQATGGVVVPIHIKSTRVLRLGIRGWKV